VLRGPLVPAVPSCILDPLREEFLALLPPRVDRHPLGCHRRRIDDRIVFDKIVAALVFGCGYERLGDATARPPRCAAGAMSGSPLESSTPCAPRCWPPTNG
jgi:hypothetical protein